MPKQMPHLCPSCGSSTIVSELKCTSCDTVVRGEFTPTPLGSLSEEQLSFIRTFVLSRGSIREMEKRLQVSYPTVRARLDEVIAALSRMDASGRSREEILKELEEGRLTAVQAIEELNKLNS
jgi:hypothetical protein